MATADDLERLETDVLAGFVLARASAGLADGTIRGDVSHLEQMRSSFGRPLWEMEPSDADAYFGRVLRHAPIGTRLARVRALSVYFEFLELRHQVELHTLTGIVARCPIDEVNRPRGRKDARLRIPPSTEELTGFFADWAQALAGCRKFAPAARTYAAARLMAATGLRANETRRLDLDDVRWDLGHFGKLHVRHGKGANGSGPRERMVPLLSGSDALLRWYIEDVWGQLDPGSHTRPGAALFAAERKAADGSAMRVSYEMLRAGLAEAVAAHLPHWCARLTPHVLRHYCASQLHSEGVDLLSIQEMLGHAWVATTMRYVHIHHSRIEDAWRSGQQRAAARLEGLI
ncbi:tyrosine-type recombinase/integrase [Streptomyces sp. BH104]|uniref:tyrosine-type recombinase/integrase n=1 Tax=Streptomyces sp. BH104 TaxID=3410407 RepID=UPI003BB66392